MRAYRDISILSTTESGEYKACDVTIQIADLKKYRDWNDIGLAIARTLGYKESLVTGFGKFHSPEEKKNLSILTI